MRLTATFLLGVLSLALTACESDSSANADAADKYVGQWSMCMVTDAASSDKTTIVVTKKSADAINVMTTITQYPGLDCSGSPLSNYMAQQNVSFTGSKTIDNNTVDKIELTIESDSDANTTEPRVFKDLWYVSENVLYLGAQNNGLDEQGYPLTINLGWGLSKQ